MLKKVQQRNMNEQSSEADPPGSSGELVLAVVCVDDTDDITRDTSTGKIAKLIANKAAEFGGRLRFGVTRHQLLLREDVPYTSHNSSMAFEVFIPSANIEAFYQSAVEIINKNRALSSDPGLCVACIPLPEAVVHHMISIGTRPSTPQELVSYCTFVDGAEDRSYLEQLIDFGKRAKVDFCTKDSAYLLAKQIPWVKLSKHGASGSGIVGALAGVGLRIGGNDGRFRGKWDLGKLCGFKGTVDILQVTECLARAFLGPVKIIDDQGKRLPSNTLLASYEEIKPVLLENTLTILCKVEDGFACPHSVLGPKDAKERGLALTKTCVAFEWDNDSEECVDQETTLCQNCLYRRMVANGYSCIKGLSSDAFVFALSEEEE